MSNTFTKNGFRGFTLIELLVVIAIIGLLSTIIAAPIQSARKKARDAKKIAELKSTQLALEQYAESNSAQYPQDLSNLSPQFMPLLSGFASATSSTARDAFAYVFYTASSTGSDSQIFAYHMGSKLEVYGPALETDRDCAGATLSNSLVLPHCAVYNGNSLQATFVDNGAQLRGITWSAMGGGVTTTIGTYATARDFQSAKNPLANVPAGASLMSTGKYMAEESSSTCVSTTDCIFDITSQQ